MIFGTQCIERRGMRRLLPSLALIVCTSMFSGGAWAKNSLLFNNEPVHPACLYDLVTQAEGDRLPITLAVSLAGCGASARGALAVTEKDEAITIADEKLIGPGNFAYRPLSRLENGIYAIGVRRIDGEGKSKVSLAAVTISERPMIRNGMVIQVPTLELLGLLPLPDSDLKSFRRVGNKVQVRVGAGPNAMDRSVDLTELGKALKKR